jgi:membrane-bound lytic murein transglycosylase A
LKAWAGVLAALALAACATAPTPPRSPAYVAPQLGPPAPLTALPGWNAEDHAAAFAAFRDECFVAHDPAMAEVCEAAHDAGRLSDADARVFLIRHFRAEPVEDEGVLTAYFAPLYEAKAHPDGEFTAPLRPPPADPGAAGVRSDIEHQPARDALAWMRPEDLFFLQIQGSGQLYFPDGRRMKAVFAASNNQPFVGIARPMADRGLVAPGASSSGALHDWLAAHRGPEADDVMRLDPRYIFFQLLPDDGREPAGAAGAPLIAGRSLAVDPTHHAMGEVLWIDAGDPMLDGARGSYQRLTLALDTGSAIRGEARADLYLGRGAAAGDEAGRVRHRLRMWRLIPVQH